MRPTRHTVEMLRDLIAESRSILVFSGAGISVDSGIPDFRSPGGAWERVDPMAISSHRFGAGRRAQAAYWAAVRAILPRHPRMRPSPNPSHDAVTALQTRGRLLGVVTQNVDGLHQAAGTHAVAELHGSLDPCRCQSCGAETSWGDAVELLLGGAEVPPCGLCGGPLKPDVVGFGDSLPEAEMARAREWAATCDLCLVLGSSLEVYPAAGIPVEARESGSKLAIVTLSGTPLDAMAHVRLYAPLLEAFVPAVGAS